MKEHNLLSNETITSLIAKNNQKPIDVKDGLGLYLRVFQRAANWRYSYRQNYRRVKIGLGGYPAVSLKEARAKTAEFNALRARDIDPRQHTDNLKFEKKKKTFSPKPYRTYASNMSKPMSTATDRALSPGKSTK